jgi:hypothetical protein
MPRERRRLLAPDLPEATAQQGHDFLLNLRIVQQTQEHLLESLVLLGLLDLVFSFGSIFHRSIMPSFRQPSVPVSRPQTSWRNVAPDLRDYSSPKSLRVYVKIPSWLQFFAT